MSLLLMICLSGCGNQSTEQTNTPPANEPQAENNSQNVSEETTPQPEAQSEPTLADIENYMLDNGMLSGNRIQMAADMVGAIDGFKYSDSGVEIYEYDTESETYITLSGGGEIELKGMSGYTVGCVAVNGKFVLFGEPSEDAIKCFENFE